MFSPATRRPNLSSRKGRNLGHSLAAPGSPATPVAENRKSAYNGNFIPDRPSTGTPAPWAPRLSVLARISPAKKGEKGDDIDPTKPVFIGEFPQLVRDEQSRFWRNRLPGDAFISGGMDKATCLAWFICGSKLFVWSYLTTMSSKKCVVLDIPFGVLGTGDSSGALQDRKSWLISIVSWDALDGAANRVGRSCGSAGIVMCSIKTRALVYWPDIFSEGDAGPVTSFSSSDETEPRSSPVEQRSSPFRQLQSSGLQISGAGSSDYNSLITTAVAKSEHVCVALACSSNGELWQFRCSPTRINRNQVSLHILPSESKGYPRSLIWCCPQPFVRDSNRQFFLLTDREIQCFSVDPDLVVSKVWRHEIVGTDGDLGIKKDLASQKQIWPLDLQVDDQGEVITVLVATICMDRVSSSSYTQYSLLTMQHKSKMNIADGGEERVLEKKAPIQVIIPKARVENEGFLFSMRLRVGGRPPGSAIMLSGDGTATVSYCYGNSTRLYKFDLPYDAGKVLDASVLPSTDEHEYGAWVVLTEKAGVWAIPEKAVILGGVEPPERSLSRKGSSNERSPPEEARKILFSGNVNARRASSDLLGSGDKEKSVASGITCQTVRDEESEALLGHLFEDFLLSGKVDGSLEKLQKSGAFDRDGETSVFTRKSKSVVDTLAKHWTTTRGAEIVAMAVISSQLVEKQQKHEKFLHFLALSKCHEELCSKQRHSLQIILEHGEKLAAMVALRELQNLINQSHSAESGPPHSGTEAQLSCALWDVIQLVGERARRNTVLLMDRDNAEVFYSKVSELEEVFYCLDRQLEYIVSSEQQVGILVQRVCELSNVCVTIIQTAMEYRNEHQMWYPPLEGLTPWHSQPVVRNGLWQIASFMLQLLTESSGLDMSAKVEIYMHLKGLTGVVLEAYIGATTAKVERGEENKGLLDEYWRRRDTLFDCLFQQAKEFVDAGYLGIIDGIENTEEDIFRKLCSDLLIVAKRHEGYKFMWRICYDLNDTELLRSLMREGMGPQGGFSYFVFKQLYDMKQFSKLLRLGEEFQEELLIFLKRHRDLLWLHEVFLYQFSSASDTLHALAVLQDVKSIATTEERAVTELGNPKQTLADRKRFLNLSKIAAMADKDAEAKSKVERIEADLNLLKLQEEITLALPTNEEIRQQLVRPEELIELCLRSHNRGLALKAFDVFAWTSSSFRKSHAVLLKGCWRKAADQDNWVQLHQAFASKGWTDEETLQELRKTVLFQASYRCYGHQAETIDGGFGEILPLRQEDPENDSTSSVEAILRQHKDFAETGKLMLTAIMLGCGEDGIAAEEDLPSPME